MFTADCDIFVIDYGIPLSYHLKFLDFQNRPHVIEQPEPLPYPTEPPREQYYTEPPREQYYTEPTTEAYQFPHIRVGPTETPSRSPACHPYGAHSCHAEATCKQYSDGGCCRCKSGFYGNGKECLRAGNTTI